MGMPIFQVDAFASEPFEGNPAGVCLLSEERDERWMQKVALEMNLSETAFLVQRGEGFDLRWFTPKTEVDLCGHATLASAHVLWEEGVVPPGDAARFHTKSGLLTAERLNALIEMDFPAKAEEAARAPAGLAKALGAEPLYLGRNAFDLIALLEDEKTVRELSPDCVKLSALDVRGVIVTAEAGGSEFDFVSRFFAPAVGVNEDPVTGSAHCCLAPFWARRLGKEEMTGFQASPRGGVVGVRVEGARVRLRGRAVTFFKGEMRA